MGSSFAETGRAGSSPTSPSCPICWASQRINKEGRQLGGPSRLRAPCQPIRHLPTQNGGRAVAFLLTPTESRSNVCNGLSQSVRQTTREKRQKKQNANLNGWRMSPIGNTTP